MRTLATLAAGFLTLGVASPAPESNWQAMARQDLTGIRDGLQANFPGVYVEKDSSQFRDWLEKGYRAALADVPKVHDPTGYYYLVNGYTAGFRDSHIKLRMASASNMKPAIVAWPGLATGWRDGRYRVAYVDEARKQELPPLNAQLIQCDGRSAESIAKDRLDRYEGDLDLEGSRYFTAPKLLWDLGNPFVGPRPSDCTFEMGGTQRHYKMHYLAPMNDLAAPIAAAAGHLTQTALAVDRWRDGWWIGLPSMNSDQHWEEFFANVERQKDAIRGAPYVVIDVRGNHGGDSAYPERLATILWGDAIVRFYAPSDGDEVYRVSPANRKFFADSLQRFDKTQADEYGKEYTDLVSKMDAATVAGQPLVVLHYPQENRPATPPADPMKARIVVLLTDYTCNSACLDMMDMYRAFPHAVQAGVSTFADTIFMEETRVPLPSGNASLTFGHKALVQRPRASNQPYRPLPQYTYHGDLADDNAMRTWVANVVIGLSGSRQ